MSGRDKTDEYFDAVERAEIIDGVLYFPADYPLQIPEWVREGIEPADRTVEELMALHGVSEHEAEFMLALSRGEVAGCTHPQPRQEKEAAD